MKFGMSTWIIALIALASFATSGAEAQAPSNVTTTVHKGRCSVFMFGDKQLSCDKVLHNHYPKDNHQSFIFDIPNGLLGLSGGQTKILPPSGYTLLVDAVTVLQDDGKDTKKHGGEGICSGIFTDASNRRTLRAMHCEAKYQGRQITVQFDGGGEAGTILKSESILNGVERFYATYKEIGIQGVVRRVQECYDKIKYRGDVEPLAHCFAMDYTAYKIDDGASKVFGQPPNKFTGSSNVVRRAGNSLRKFGYDNDAAVRQITAWRDQIERWMTESGRQ